MSTRRSLFVAKLVAIILSTLVFAPAATSVESPAGRSLAARTLLVPPIAINAMQSTALLHWSPLHCPAPPLDGHPASPDDRPQIMLTNQQPHASVYTVPITFHGMRPRPFSSGSPVR